MFPIGLQFPGEGAVYQYQDLKFTAPAYINDELTVKVEVLEKISKNKFKLSTSKFNQNNVKVLEGNAMVSVPV